MKAYIILNPLGVFGVSEKKQIVDQVLFPKNIEKMVNALLNKDITKQEKELIERLKKKGYTKFISSKRTEEYEFETDNFGETIIRQQFRQIAKDLGYPDTQLNKLLTRIGIEFTKRKTKENVKKDRIVIQAINAIDEMDKSINIFVARLREWYGFHFPEMEREIKKHENFVKLISEYGLRKNMKEFSELAKTSMGIDLSKKDEEILKEYATKIKELYKLREHMEKYVGSVLKEIAPNFSALAGPLLAARLIALVGGMERLAKKPSSTVQLLGAEKALFRHLRGKGRSPRFGILFTHPLVQQVPDRLRGKIARSLASKLSIAIRMDFYGKEDISKKLKEELDKSMKKAMAD